VTGAYDHGDDNLGYIRAGNLLCHLHIRIINSRKKVMKSFIPHQGARLAQSV
jgi:hypothetical protein